MTKPKKPPPIEITRQHTEPDGSVEVRGTFRDFPGWTFEASVAENIAWDSDAWTEYAGTRLTSVGLSYADEHYVSNPDYDGDVPQQKTHDEMFRQIDLRFGPSPEERVRLCEERDAERDRVFDALSEFVEQQLSDAAPETIQRAASQLEDAYRARST